VRVLLATDAAGEGVNLQNANLMVNYDLPWNPNRLEQRFGRIHRIGQTEVCHLWNMVAAETREGDVFQRLFEKLEVERAGAGRRVFDILGEVFEDKSLKDLLIEAIRYGADPRFALGCKVEGALDTQHLETSSSATPVRRGDGRARLFAVKEEMEKAEARKLQPFFIRSFFNQAFQQLGGELRPREPGASRSPTSRPSSASATGRSPAATAAMPTRCCAATSASASRSSTCVDRRRADGQPDAPGHPLMQSVTDLVLEQHRNKLKQARCWSIRATWASRPR
jgi:superfamily II DNA/RNA helicase